MKNIRIVNANIINEGTIKQADLRIENGLIAQIGSQLSGKNNEITLDAQGKYLIPGIIDDQVHFREPGLTHKGNIYSESRAAVAGGVTTFMEMPNTVPNALTQTLLDDKYQIAARTSLANFSFFMGVSNDNFEEVMKTDPRKVCGLKIFMGSSTGNMLVDNPGTLEKVFSESSLLIATHCEDEATVKANSESYKVRYGENVLPEHHAEIRDEKACLLSSSMAVDLAKKHNTRLHVLHISTADELSLFSNALPLEQKRITSEVCIHHLWFTQKDYSRLGNLIKWNPSIKGEQHQPELWKALLDNRLDIIATDHAPHTWEEKQKPYWQAPSGGPLVQHAFNVMWECYKQGRISLEKIIEKMCHAPALCFQLERRGFVREGYWADLAIVDPQASWQVKKENILYHCGWSALEGMAMSAKITHTIVSGHLAYVEGQFNESQMGQRVLFSR